MLQNRVVLRLTVLLLVLPAVAEDRTWQHGVSMFGNLKYPPDFMHLEYANPDAPKGGTLVLAGTYFTNLTPFLYRGVYPRFMLTPPPGPLYDSLFVPANDELYSVYGNLAESIRIGNDLSTVEIRLRDNAYWHDGVPITAKDVKFTFDHVTTSSMSGARTSLPIESIEILDESELLFRFRRISGLNKRDFMGPMTYFPILPEHYWRKRDLSETTLKAPLGSGPYRIADLKQGSSILLERVPDYWGRHLSVNKGRHNFDFIRYDIYRDETVAFEAFLKGLLDFRTEVDPYRWRTAYDVPARDRGWLIMDQHNSQVRSGFQSALVFNIRRDKLSDIRVREALMLAFDFEWTNRVVFIDFFGRPGSYFSGSPLAARGLPSQGELELLEPFRQELPARLFSEPFVLPKTTGHGRYRPGLVRARELFKEAGWTIRDGVMMNTSGEAFTLEFLSDSPSKKRTLLPYMDQLRQLGIVSNIRLMDSAQYVNRTRRFDYDALLVAVPFGFPVPSGIIRHFHSNAANTQSSANLVGVSSPVVDTLIVALRESGDDLERLTAAARALDRTLLWRHYMIPIFGWQQQGNVVYWDKFGRPGIDAKYLTSFPDTWWWDGERASRIHLEGN